MLSVLLKSKSRGVLLKQFYHQDWKASVEGSDGQRQSVSILRAGPDFMYVQVPDDLSYPVRVAFHFDKTVDYLGLGVNAASLLFLVGYAIIGPRATPFSRMLVGIKRRVHEWWQQG